MGNTQSPNIVQPVNYNCPVCSKTGALPNIAGRFFIINEKECQCNGCGSNFPKEQFYKSVADDTTSSK
jgi:hypothetical protein